MYSSHLLHGCQSFIMALLLVTFGSQYGLAHNQWDINHGGNNPTQDPRFAPGGIYSGYVPQFTPDFWANSLPNRIPIGTVLSGILEDDLSSAKNKSGDTFTLTLQDGFTLNGRQLVPPNSKIVGTVNAATPARLLKGGHPGQLKISLQSLVFPDGQHLPIYAFMDCNPNHTSKEPPKVRHLGKSIADYGESVAAMFGSVLTGPGFMMNKRNRGLDFVVDKGEVLPIRLTRSLNIPVTENLLSRPLQANQPGTSTQAGKGALSQTDPATPGSAGAPYPPTAVPGLVDPQGPWQVPAAGQVPQAAPSGSTSLMPPAASKATDQNEFFHQPVRSQQLDDMPDPF